MTQQFRTHVGRPYRSQPRAALPFRRPRLPGHPGDTLASALLANGVRLVGRSFKLHRPRGIFAAGAEEPNALAEMRSGARREPNTRMTMIELYEGLEAASQNRFPSLRFDLMAAAGLVAPLLAAGFYYKTFMWPASFWEKVYEPLDPPRRRAGPRLRRCPIPTATKPMHAHCDVLVVGSGAAGLAAARVAGAAGARVILCEQDFLPGGGLLAERPHELWREQALAALAAMPEVTLLPRTHRVRLLRPQRRGRDGAGRRPSAAAAAAHAAPALLDHPRARRSCWRPARMSGSSLSPATIGPA